MDDVNAAGFVTEEQPGKKGKSDIVLKTLDGREMPFATSHHKGKGKRVGKYLVDVEAFENLALDAIAFHPGTDLYVIDEIGPMETMSRTFSETAKMLLKNDKVAVLATVSKQGRGFIREVKRMPGLESIELTSDNAQQVEEDLVGLLTASLMAPEAPNPD
jgi:nucleoside-triphosphatase THEP1